MSRQRAFIISGAARALASSETGDLHDVTGHHRYYGSSACKRIVETRRGSRLRSRNVCGF